MFYRFKIKENARKNSKIIFVSAWFKACGIMEAIKKRDAYIDRHREYASRTYAYTWEEKTRENKPRKNSSRY